MMHVCIIIYVCNVCIILCIYLHNMCVCACVCIYIYIYDNMNKTNHLRI